MAPASRAPDERCPHRRRERHPRLPLPPERAAHLVLRPPPNGVRVGRRSRRLRNASGQRPLLLRRRVLRPAPSSSQTVAGELRRREIRSCDELVSWADRIDAARFESAAEAVDRIESGDAARQRRRALRRRRVSRAPRSELLDAPARRGRALARGRSALPAARQEARALRRARAGRAACARAAWCSSI